MRIAAAITLLAVSASAFVPASFTATKDVAFTSPALARVNGARYVCRCHFLFIWFYIGYHDTIIYHLKNNFGETMTDNV